MKYEIVVYQNDVKIIGYIEAPTRADAQRMAWETFDADDIYIAEVYNDDGC